MWEDIYVRIGCDLHLGDSRLQWFLKRYPIKKGCDLHLGDSRLQ